MNLTTKQIWVTSTLASMLFVTGCQGFLPGAKTSKKQESQKESWFSFGKKEYQEPHKIAVVWSEDVMVSPGSKPTRGFGGRIYFYNDHSQAIPVDGDLVVYGYDDSTKGRVINTKREADKRFRFTAEQFTEHFTETDLGASYSVWIPWDAEVEQRTAVTLIPTFITKTGKVIAGEASKAVLSGVEQNPLQEVEIDGPVRAVSHTEPAKPTMRDSQASGMRTTTITLPQNSTFNRPGSGSPITADQVRQAVEQMNAASSSAQANFGLVQEPLAGYAPSLKSPVPQLSYTGLPNAGTPDSAGVAAPNSQHTVNAFQSNPPATAPNRTHLQQASAAVAQPISTQPTTTQSPTPHASSPFARQLMPAIQPMPSANPQSFAPGNPVSRTSTATSGFSTR